MNNWVVPFTGSGAENEEHSGRGVEKTLPEDNSRVESRGYIDVFQKEEKTRK